MGCPAGGTVLTSPHGRYRYEPSGLIFRKVCGDPVLQRHRQGAGCTSDCPSARFTRLQEHRSLGGVSANLKTSEADAPVTLNAEMRQPCLVQSSHALIRVRKTEGSTTLLAHRGASGCAGGASECCANTNGYRELCVSPACCSLPGWAETVQVMVRPAKTRRQSCLPCRPPIPKTKASSVQRSA